MAAGRQIRRVMVTGATGFVGWSVVRQLLARGYEPVCVVRRPEQLARQHAGEPPGRVVAIRGDLADAGALREAATQSHACLHLVGIILERRLSGQTFRRVHVEGTRCLLDACREAGLERLVHMSALGTRADAPGRYHQSKWAAEQLVAECGLAWTVFQPSVIHGPRGAFLRLMKRLSRGPLPPVVPCFGDGSARLQPVSVEDVARCMVASLTTPTTIGRRIPLGGPDRMTWRELYALCQRVFRGGRSPKPILGLPPVVAKAMALLSAGPLALAECVVSDVGLFRFGADHVDMAQEDNVCDHTIAEQVFGITMRGMEQDLIAYADSVA